MTVSNKEPEIRTLISAIWYELVDATTRSSCMKCKTNYGRNRCIPCLKKELAELTSVKDAEHFIECARSVKAAESKLTEFRPEKTDD